MKKSPSPPSVQLKFISFNFILLAPMDFPPSDLDDYSEQQMMQLPVIELELLFCCPNSSCICSFKEEHLLTKHMEKCDGSRNSNSFAQRSIVTSLQEQEQLEATCERVWADHCLWSSWMCKVIQHWIWTREPFASLWRWSVSLWIRSSDIIQVCLAPHKMQGQFLLDFSLSFLQTPND